MLCACQLQRRLETRMVQRKKPEVREAILVAAFRLFASRGYAATMVADIAREAGVSPGNVYIYFRSKLEILYEIYDPWLRARIDALGREIAALRSPRARLRRLLVALWREIPAEENGFLNNMPAEGYRSTLVRWLEQRITAMIGDALPPARRARIARVRLAHVLVMAFDGCAIDYHLHRRPRVDDRTIDFMTEMLLGAPAGRAIAAGGTARRERANGHASRIP
jgi:AcrR family transcriptional regulator